MDDELFNKSCIGLFEAVRGRLIGPKTWDQIVVIFLRIFLWPCQSRKLWAACDDIMH